MKRIISWKTFTVAVVAVLGLCLASPAAFAAKKKPNILVIWGDDVGYWNVSAYNQGMMGYETPKIDSIAKEGALFTDWYAQQSCTAGRAAFILGQHPFRTGLLTIGMPGSDQGIGDGMVTLATLLKPHGYTSGQRPGQTSADGPRLRRVLRQPLPSQRRGRARGLLLSERSRIP